MPAPNPTRPYTIPGFRVALVREPGVKLAERPQLRTAAEAAPVLAQYIGESDREVFVVAMLTVRHRLIGLHTVSVGCLTSSLVHPRLCAREHRRYYVAAVVMLRSKRKALVHFRFRLSDTTLFPRLDLPRA
jgi:DNA repair protein RadC